MFWDGYLLANEQHIDLAEVKVIEEGERSQPVVRRVLPSIKLHSVSSRLQDPRDEQMNTP